jgi:hypothetical protein
MRRLLSFLGANVSVIVIRLHPVEPTDGTSFTPYLKGLAIKVSDRSYADPKGATKVLGTAKYIAAGDPKATIVQHVDPVTGLDMPVATAAIEVAKPLPFKEYMGPDLVLTITRTVAPNPAQTIITHEINFNVDLAKGKIPSPNDPLDFAALSPVALYLALPKPLVGLAAGTAYLEISADGTPPPFDAVRNAVETVMKKDPKVPPPPLDLTRLTPEQCQHLAWEIVSNRTLDPLPEPSKPLEQLYSGGDETARRKFESELLTYYTVHNTRVDVLTKFIYSMSAALACEQTTKEATRIGMTFPILPGLSSTGDRVAETTVVISQ